MTAAVFWFFAAVAVLSAALCILQRSPVSAALWLVSTMFSLAAIYVLLGAQFIAAIQVLVYAGAVMVLFLFVIMLLNLGRSASDIRGPGAVTTAVVVVGLLVGELIALWRYTPHRLAAELAQAAPFSDPSVVFAAGDIARQESQARGVVGGIAAPLFQVYLVPFVGAVVLAKRKA
jgi:NADH-quinone oxidoreductase subunit J